MGGGRLKGRTFLVPHPYPHSPASSTAEQAGLRPSVGLLGEGGIDVATLIPVNRTVSHGGSRQQLSPT